MSDPDTALLEIDELTVERTLGDGESEFALRSLSLSIKSKEIVVLVGESGSGKSTLATLLIGVEAKGMSFVGGTVRFDGEDLFALPRKQRRRLQQAGLSYLGRHHEEAFNLDLTVSETLNNCLRNRLVAGGERQDRELGDWFYKVGIVEPERILPRQIGDLPLLMVQRLAVLRALISGARLIICDDAASGLDRVAARQFYELMVRVRDEEGLSFLVTTGRIRGADQFADRVGILFDGSVLEMATADTIMRKPTFAYTKEFFACEPSLMDRPRTLEAISREAMEEAEASIRERAMPVANTNRKD